MTPDYKQDAPAGSGSDTFPRRLKAAIDFAAVTARLKPCPFKAESKWGHYAEIEPRRKAVTI